MTLQSTPGNLFLEKSSQRKKTMPKDDKELNIRNNKDYQRGMTE